MQQLSLLPSPPALTALKTKKSKEQVIREQLLTNGRWAVRGLLAIYRYQTVAEQRKGSTLVKNKVGFSAFDAQTMTALAEQVIRGQQLTSSQYKMLHPRIARYSKQLLEIATQNGTA
jgi:hypothetical protein